MRNLIPLLVLLVLLAACGSEAPSSPPARTTPLAIASFYPLEYMARRIGGEDFEVRCPLDAESDPVSWKPDAAQVAELQGADLILVNGAGFEEWVAHHSLPPARLVETAHAFRAEWIEYAGGDAHRHGSGDLHSHTGTDGHTWLDPHLALRQASAIFAAMERRLPAKADALRTRHEALAEDLRLLGAEFAALPPAPPLLASHPAYNYLARRLGWKVTNFDLDPEEALTAAQVEAVVSTAREAGTTLLLWESEPIAGIRAALEKQGGIRSIVVSPVESAPASGDYLAAMRENVARLAAAFASSGDR